MKRLPRPMIAGLIAIAAAIVLGASLWSLLGLQTAHERGGRRDAVTLETRPTEPASAAPAEPGLSETAPPKRAERSATKRDLLLENLRAKLSAKNVVPNEALITFRNAEA